VFVVAHLGEGNLAAKVLFESESVRRDTPPRRETRQGVATNVEAGVGVSLPEREVVGCLSDGAHMGGGLNGQDAYSGRIMAVANAIPIHDQATRNAGKRGNKQDGKGNGLGVGKPGDPCPTLTKGDKHAVLYENHPNDSRVTGPHDVAPSCVSRYGTGGGNVPLVQEAIAFPATMSGTQCAKTKNLSPAICSVNQTAIAFEPGIATREGNESRFVKELSPTLRKEMGDNQVAVAVDTYNHALQEKAVPIRSTASDICHTGGVINPADRMAVRRLTPKECERLQGFNDDHTMIPWRNKPADQCPDGPRYKALGNSMAVPCMAWIGKRIDAVEKSK
jgi:DNA (cytosine-5)-methyltransferase 1